MIKIYYCSQAAAGCPYCFVEKQDSDRSAREFCFELFFWFGCLLCDGAFFGSTATLTFLLAF